MEPESSLPHLKVPAGCHPEKDQYSLCLPIILLEDPFLILSSHPRVDFPSGLFPTGLPTKKTPYAAPLSPIGAICTVDRGEATFQI